MEAGIERQIRSTSLVDAASDYPSGSTNAIR